MIPPTSRAPSRFEDRERVSARPTRVDHDGLAELAREADEAREDVALRLARRPVVVVVEADLADRRDLGRAAASARSPA